MPRAMHLLDRLNFALLETALVGAIFRLAGPWCAARGGREFSPYALFSACDAEDRAVAVARALACDAFGRAYRSVALLFPLSGSLTASGRSSKQIAGSKGSAKVLQC
jgi:hypothetical protein